MEERTIELTVISATDLKKVVKFGKQTCYAVAYIYPKQKKQTKKDSGGTDPSWDQKLTLTCDEQQLLGGRLVITVELFSDGTFSDKLIGTVTIPVSEIAKDTIGKESKESKEEGEEKEELKDKEHAAQYLAFEVRRPSGKAKGVLNAAVKFGQKRTIQVYQSQPPSGAYAHNQRNGQSSSEPQVPYPATGYPPAPGYPNQFPPQPYGAPAGYPNQYPPQQVPYYGQQPAPYYPQQPPPYYQQQPPPRRGGGGGMGLGLGAGLLGGAIGGLLVADAIDDMGDCGDMDF